MIFKILPVAVVMFSCVGNYHNVDQEQQSVKLTPQKAYDSSSRIYGSYNWQSTFVGLYDFAQSMSTNSFSIDFEPNYLEDYRFLCPCWIDDYYFYCRKIDFSFPSTYLQIDIYIYSREDYRSSYTFLIHENSTITDITYSGQGSPSFYDFILNVREPYYADVETSQLFNLVFTNQDNAYTTTYSGYYNFASNLSSIGYRIGLFGYVSFNNLIYFGFTNSYFSSLETNKLNYEYYNEDLGEFTYYTYNLPFDKDTVLFNNVLFSGAKMPLTTYNRLSARGIFAYQRDTTYDDTDFEGLLFTVADTPVYFISQFLNFELFGMNLFVALSGLITLLVVIFIIRKII